MSLAWIFDVNAGRVERTAPGEIRGLRLALMAYPYFVPNDIVLFAIGVVGTAALFLFRD